MSLEDKLTQLMKALKGVDPATVAAGGGGGESQPKVTSPEAATGAEEKESGNRKQKQGEDQGPGSGGGPPDKSDTDTPEREEAASNDGKNAQSATHLVDSAASGGAVPQSAPAPSGGVEDLMRQFVSSLRDELHNDDEEGMSANAKLVLEKKSAPAAGQDGESAAAAAAAAVDYSKLSMEELLNQLDDMVDATTEKQK